MTIHRFIRYGAPVPSLSASSFVAIGLLAGIAAAVIGIGEFVGWMP